MSDTAIFMFGVVVFGVAIASTLVLVIGPSTEASNLTAPIVDSDEAIGNHVTQ